MTITPEIIESPELTLSNSCGYAIQGESVVITVEQIANNRSATNLSGTLALELWALEQSYAGGDFAGSPLAAVSIGELSGAHMLSNLSYSLLFTAPSAGAWSVVLMLREWENGAFVTRAWQNFDQPYVVADVVSESVDTETQPEPVFEILEAPAVEEETPAVEENNTVSLNKASAAELSAIKGISRKLAAAIVAGRPYAALEDVLKVKGMGKKSLDKVRKVLSL